MTYVLINNAPDGRHCSVYGTEQGAVSAMRSHIGRPVEGVLGRDYYSDWGNRLVIEERPAGWTAKKEEQLSRAYDARECGNATASQLELLEDAGFI